jgi:predicted ArsR family transcriptional regulator
MRARHTTQHAIAFAIIVRELLEGPCTALELAEETGVRHETMLGWIRALRRQHAIHVSSWVEDTYGRRSTAAYVLGNKPDAPRRPMAPIDIKRRYTARLRRRQLAQAIDERLAA